MACNRVDSDSGIRILGRGLGDHAYRNRGVVELLLDVLDNECGPDKFFLIKICVFGLGHLTTAKTKKGRLTVRSTDAFEERLGVSFKVHIDERELGMFFNDFLRPEQWPSSTQAGITAGQV